MEEEENRARMEEKDRGRIGEGWRRRTWSMVEVENRDRDVLSNRNILE